MTSTSPSPPTRAEFLRSRFYRCALSFNKRNEERLKTIRELLEKVDEKKKKPYVRPPNKKRYTPFQLPDVDPSSKKGRNSQEDRAISNADYDKTKWVYNEAKQEYVLSFGTMKVMTVPKDMYLRLKPFQRDAVKWIASVGPVGGILADDMGMGKTVCINFPLC